MIKIEYRDDLSEMQLFGLGLLVILNSLIAVLGIYAFLFEMNAPPEPATLGTDVTGVVMVITWVADAAVLFSFMLKKTEENEKQIVGPNNLPWE